MPGPRPSPRDRWRHWQERRESALYLQDGAAERGYTVLYVPPVSRDVFFDCLGLLQVQARLGVRPLGAEAQAALGAWRTWTRRLTAYLTRLAEGKPGTLPTLPPDLAAMASHLYGEGDCDALSTS